MNDKAKNKHRIKHPQEQDRKGVQIVGGGAAESVKRESKQEGGSLETNVEIGLDQNERDESGRRVFHK